MGARLTVRALRHLRGGREVLSVDRLDVGAGERLAVLGPNGAGKTSLLRLFAALDEPTRGTVEIDGVRARAGDAAARRRIGYATQQPGLLSTTVRRNVELPLRWRGAAGPERERAALGALERLGVAHLAGRRAGSLSGGEAQRVSLARALALEPELLLLDEPAARLDAEARRAFLDDLDAALADRRTTVVHVSHRSEEALRLADRVAVLRDGTLHQLATPSELIRRPADATVATLVGYDNVVPVETDAAGQVLLAGAPCGLFAVPCSGDATLAAWGRGVRLRAPGGAPLRGTVEDVAPGPGHWDVVVRAGVRLHAHLDLAEHPPPAGERLGVELDPTHCTVIPRQRGQT